MSHLRVLPTSIIKLATGSTNIQQIKPRQFALLDFRDVPTWRQTQVNAQSAQLYDTGTIDDRQRVLHRRDLLSRVKCQDRDLEPIIN